MLKKILKYEFINILRNKWVFGYTVLIGAISIAFLEISDNPTKALVSMSSVVAVLVPLIAILFSAVYWYYSERFTELLLTQPLKRAHLFLARLLALTTSLCASFLLGIGLPFLFAKAGAGLLLSLANGFFLTSVFVICGILVATFVVDRMKGIGLVLAIWFYFSLIHDGFVLLFLLGFREYPLDLPAAFLGAMNPVGLVRVVSLVYYDASMLLGHTGALVRNLVSHAYGAGLALLVAVLWLMVPGYLASRRFIKRDF